MKPKAYVFAGLAIVCGLGASYMTSRLLAERTPDEPEKVEILVAKRPLNVGERVTRPEEMFEMKAVTKENEPPDALKDFEQVKNKIMKQGRNRGEHITPSNLYDKDLLDIPEGHQAVGVPVNLATTAHGLATLPGSRVNLILTVRGNDARTSSSRVLLQNVLVLAADGRTTREGGEGPTAAASVVTFALTPKDALKVSLADKLGLLSLTLRKLNEPITEEGEVVNGNELFEARKKAEPKPEVAVAPPAVETKPEAPKVVEDPKDIRTLIINNGVQQSRYDYEVLPNGQIRDAGNPPAAPAPPAPTTPGLTGKREV